MSLCEIFFILHPDILLRLIVCCWVCCLVRKNFCYPVKILKMSPSPPPSLKTSWNLWIFRFVSFQDHPQRVCNGGFRFYTPHFCSVCWISEDSLPNCDVPQKSCFHQRWHSVELCTYIIPHGGSGGTGGETGSGDFKQGVFLPIKQPGESRHVINSRQLKSPDSSRECKN